MASGDLTLPWAAWGAVGTAISGVVGWLARALAAERATCDKRVAAVEERLAKIEAQGATEAAAWRDRWALEVEAKVRAYNAPAPAVPMRPPLPSYDDSSEVRQARTAVEAGALEKELRDYVESKRPAPGAKLPT